MTTSDRSLDVVTIGRSSVDLYGAQVGGRLEDMGSFEKYIGGSPTNIACGTARLGLKSAVITGVGTASVIFTVNERVATQPAALRISTLYIPLSVAATLFTVALLPESTVPSGVVQT